MAKNEEAGRFSSSGYKLPNLCIGEVEVEVLFANLPVPPGWWISTGGYAMPPIPLGAEMEEYIVER
jgi:hypothetical protein